MSDPIASLGLTCPSGGQFYVCQGNTTQFLGCCASDPCADGEGSCPPADVRYASFQASDYAKIQPQACASTNATDEWYTCSGSGLEHPFLGCCASNACSSGGREGCPAADLVAARLSDDESSAAGFLTTAGTASATASSSETESTGVSSSEIGSISSATVSNAATTATGAVGPQGVSAPGLSMGTKAGIGVGCAVALVTLVGVLLFFVVRRRRGVVVRGSEPPTPSNMREHQTAPSHHHDPNQILWSPHSLPSASNAPLQAARATKSPATSYAHSYSSDSSPSTGMLSRETSLRSGSSRGVGIEAPTSPLLSDGASPPQSCARQSQGQQYMYLDPREPHQPLATLAELDGTDASRPTREVPRTSPVPALYESYKPTCAVYSRG